MTLFPGIFGQKTADQVALESRIALNQWMLANCVLTMVLGYMNSLGRTEAPLSSQEISGEKKEVCDE